MGIPRRRLNLGVAQQFADHGQSLAGRHCGGSEGMSQVMNPDVLQSRPGSDALPEGLKITEPLAFQGARDDLGIILDLRGGFQAFNCRLTQMDNLCSRLGIRKAQDIVGKIDVLPLQGHDLVKAAAGEDQEPDGQNG